MRSGSQPQLASSRQAAAVIPPPAGQYSPQGNNENDVDEFSWPEDATLVPTVSGYLCIDLSDVEPIHTVAPVAPAATRRGLIHGRSPLGLAPPILASDLHRLTPDDNSKPPRRIRRKHKTEKPLARCIVRAPDFKFKFCRRRVVDLVVLSARARRANQASADASASP